jgi:hypothetical protein
MLHAWFAILAGEPNHRALSTIISIVQLLGTIVPLLVGAYIYVKRSKDAARQEMFNFFANWLSPDRQDRRVRYRKILSEHIDKELFFSNEFMEERALIAQKLNEDELLSLYILNSPEKEEAAKLFARSIVVDDWTFVERFVGDIRKHAQNASIYINLETLARRWSHAGTEVK